MLVAVCKGTISNRHEMALVSIYHGVSLWQVACPRQSPEDAFYWAVSTSEKGSRYITWSLEATLVTIVYVRYIVDSFFTITFNCFMNVVNCVEIELLKRKKKWFWNYNNILFQRKIKQSTSQVVKGLEMSNHMNPGLIKCQFHPSYDLIKILLFTTKTNPSVKI